MFGTSLGALFLALLALLLARFHLREGVIWTSASLVMFMFLIGFPIAMAFAGRRLTRLGHRPRVRFFPMAATFLLVICGLLSGLGAFGLFPQLRIAFFVLGLTACLFVSALSLVVFLVVLGRAAGGRE